MFWAIALCCLVAFGIGFWLYLWTLVPSRAVLEDGPSYLDLVAVTAAVSAIAVAYRTDGLRASVLIASPAVATAIFLPLFMTSQVFMAHTWGGDIRLAAFSTAMWMAVWFSHRARMPSVAMPYLHTVMAGPMDFDEVSGQFAG